MGSHVRGCTLMDIYCLNEINELEFSDGFTCFTFSLDCCWRRAEKCCGMFKKQTVMWYLVEYSFSELHHTRSGFSSHWCLIHQSEIRIVGFFLLLRWQSLPLAHPEWHHRNNSGQNPIYCFSFQLYTSSASKNHAGSSLQGCSQILCEFREYNGCIYRSPFPSRCCAQ